MLQKNKIRVSVASDVVDDLMNIIVHENDVPLLVGTIKDKRTVVFRSPNDLKEYDFDIVKKILLEFIELMENIENITPI